MRRESHVRFCEGGGVKFPAATRLIIFGERHLSHLIKEFIDHYMTERFHRGHRWLTHQERRSPPVTG